MAAHTMKIALEGLITLLAQNLYADPDVFLREMVQNAHDAIIKRPEVAVDRGDRRVPAGEIHIRIGPGTILVSDNGAGLTEAEVHEFLSTIGRSGTKELRAQLEDRERATELIGQFGIGLLSAFIVASRVEVVTRAAGQPAFRWVSDGRQEYEIGPGERAQVGTDVTLHLQPGKQRYLQPEKLRSIVRTYADFIGIPVFFGDDAEPANAVHAPWHRKHASEAERQKACWEFWEARFKDDVSLVVLPVDCPFTYTEGGRPLSGRVQGVLGITNRHVPDVDSRGTVDVYVRRMFIAGANRDVLPPWARFIQGVIECDTLTPNAARDNVVRNDALIQAQEALGALILEHLTALSASKPERFTEIMRWHSYHVLAMCVQEENTGFFEAVADLVPLKSDAGPITVPAYLKSAARDADGTPLLYFISEAGSALQYFVLTRARSLHVIDATEPFAERFLQRYEKTWPRRLRVSRLDVAASSAIFEELSGDERDGFRGVEVAYQNIFPDLSVLARASRFKPAELPAVLTETRDTKARRQMEEFAANPTMPAFLRNAIGGFLEQQKDPFTLHLNADNPLVQRLARRDLRDKLSEHALYALYNNALLLLSRTLTPDTVNRMSRQFNTVIDLLLESADAAERLERDRTSLRLQLEQATAKEGKKDPRTPFRSCFVATPFTDEEAKGRFDLLEQILQDLPWGVRVLRADSQRKEAGLWENVRRHMEEAHFFVADVSAHNANVMIEVGRMESLGRPVILLKAEGSPDLPADLRGRLYVEVPSGERGRSKLKEELAKTETLQCLAGVPRALSAALLQECELPAKAAGPVAERWKTIEGFLAASAEDVAKVGGVRAAFVVGAQEVLREKVAVLGKGET